MLMALAYVVEEIRRQLDEGRDLYTIAMTKKKRALFDLFRNAD